MLVSSRVQTPQKTSDLSNVKSSTQYRIGKIYTNGCHTIKVKYFICKQS